MNSFTFLFEAMKETHKQRKTKIEIDEFKSRTNNITLYGIFHYQACVYRTKAQYNRSNMILTETLSPGCQDVLSNDCIKAIKNFQCSMIKKETYLAFFVQKTIPMSFDTMTP